MLAQGLLALRLKYEAQILAAKSNLSVYQENPAGIGEHPDLVEAIESQLEILVHASEMVNEINKLLVVEQNETSE